MSRRCVSRRCCSWPRLASVWPFSTASLSAVQPVTVTVAVRGLLRPTTNHSVEKRTNSLTRCTCYTHPFPLSRVQKTRQSAHAPGTRCHGRAMGASGLVSMPDHACGGPGLSVPEPPLPPPPSPSLRRALGAELERLLTGGRKPCDDNWPLEVLRSR